MRPQHLPGKAVGRGLVDRAVLVLCSYYSSIYGHMEQENNMSDSAQSASISDNPAVLLAEGKRCLAAGDANGAVECFQEACGILASAHGQVSVELAEPYYLYGKALLDLARGNSSVLGSGIPGMPEENASSDEEDNAADENAQSSEQINEESPVSAANNEQNEESELDKNTEPVSSSTNGEAATNSGQVPGNSEVAKGSSGEAPANNEEEDESDLQIAWEVLELARVICQKRETDEYRLKLSDVNLLLGEVGLECDQYEQAILDMQSSLQLRQFVLQQNDRRIAEVHFSLGLAYTLNKQYNDALNAYNKSKETLQRRKVELEGQLSNEGSDVNKDNLESEIKELSDLLPDIDSKISDVGEMKRLMEEREKEEEGETSVGFGNNTAAAESSSSAAPQPVTDISHLVRKRAAVEDEAVSSEQPSAKKPCLPPSSSTEADVIASSKQNSALAEASSEDISSTVSEQ